MQGSRRIIFSGSGELRSGWRIAIFVIVLVALRVLQYFLLTRRLPHDWVEMPGTFLLEESVRVVAVFAATGLLAALEKRRITTYGLCPKRAPHLCVAGLVCGFGTLSLLVGALRLSGLLVLSEPARDTLTALRYGFLWLLVFLAVALFEEMTLRGYLQYAVARSVGFWWAALIWSVIFALMHGPNSGESVVGLIQAGLIGLFFCFSLWLTGSLWWAIGFHAAWDWAESYFYGTANSGLQVAGHLFTATPRGDQRLSGGPTGPEGSVLSLFVLAAPAVVLWLMYRQGSNAEPHAGPCS